MGLKYQLEDLSPEQIERWNTLILPCSQREIFHRSEWLNYLSAAHGANIRRWSIVQGGRAVGYFCAGIVRKGPFRILGSPLKSWGTNYLGPLSEEPLDTGALLGAFDDLARRERLSLFEIESPALTAELLPGAGYEPVPGWTYTVKLSSEPNDTWMAMRSSCRKSVRKAAKSGLTAEDTSEVEIADQYYDQFVDLMGRKGLSPPYSRSCPRLLFQSLRGAGLLIALRVRDAEGRLLATGLFPHDDRTIYYWGGASWQDGRDLCPNDLMHWTVMEMACRRGIGMYNMCGNGPFKRKFGVNWPPSSAGTSVTPPARGGRARPMPRTSDSASA